MHELTHEQAAAQTLCPPGYHVLHPSVGPVMRFDPPQSQIKLLWLDFETTGLDTTTRVITEAAFAFTDAQNTTLAQVVTPVAITAKQACDADPWVQTNLSETLKSALTNPERISCALLDNVLCCWLRFVGSTEEKPIIHLAGNSVWYDRAFLARLLPNAYRLLNYRQLDVTSVELFLLNAVPEHAEKDLKFVKHKVHQADKDVEESIAQYQHYLRYMRKYADGAPREVFPRLDPACPDDLRAKGWSVGVHNDYRLNGAAHTFWLFTKGDYQVKGEGLTDADALNQVRQAVESLEKRISELQTRAAQHVDILPL